MNGLISTKTKGFTKNFPFIADFNLVATYRLPVTGLRCNEIK